MKRLATIAAPIVTALVLAAPGLAPAAAVDKAAPLAAEARAAALDPLFGALARAPNDSAARRIEDQIWKIWTTAPAERAQFLLDVAFERRRGGDLAGALYALDELTRDYPDYAEGWNQRATVLFEQGRLDQSLDAIAETLAREPRHFGALTGKALILMRQGRTTEAQETLQAALRIDPWLPERGLLDPAYREERL